jgi:hypothetical protein
MKPNKLLSSILVLAGTLVLSALPAWPQAEPRGGGPGGPAEEMKGGRKEARDSEEIKKVQEVLKQKGHYRGSIDGVMDNETRNALMAFQRAQGLSATGTLDDQTKKVLGLQSQEKSKPERQSPAPGNRAPQGQDLIPRG